MSARVDLASALPQLPGADLVAEESEREAPADGLRPGDQQPDGHAAPRDLPGTRPAATPRAHRAELDSVVERVSDHSAIEWTDGTWNCVLGCDKVSDGCKYCYAIGQAWMKQHHPDPKIRAAYAGLVERRPDGSLNWTGKVVCLPERLQLPLRWKKPRRVFVNSLSDLFHEDVPDEFIDQVFAVMALSGRHTYQVLTKRPQRMACYVSDPGIAKRIGRYMTFLLILRHEGSIDPDGGTMAAWFDDGVPWPLPNVWLGVSVEDQRAADERIPQLLQTPAAIRFLSCEPLLGPVDLAHIRDRYWPESMNVNAFRGIDWVIAGGESGAKARPMHPDWARSLRDQCQAAGVAFHFKQWGGRTHAAGGRELDGRTWDEFPVARELAHA